MSSRKRTSSSPGFQNACGTPRGLTTSSPGPATRTSSPMLTPRRPRSTNEYSSSCSWTWVGAPSSRGPRSCSTSAKRPSGSSLPMRARVPSPWNATRSFEGTSCSPLMRTPDKHCTPMSTNRRYELRARAEKAAETRRRITEATVALHEEVGPARTTVAEVARRAGVQRLTVYNHFPSEGELFAACQAHFLMANPPPDVSAALAEPDPERRARAVLELLYGWYRRTEAMTANVARDAESMPELAAVLAERDAAMQQLARALTGGRRGARARALAALALDFNTWRALTRAGLSDADAAATMAQALRATAAG